MPDRLWQILVLNTIITWMFGSFAFGILWLPLWASIALAERLNVRSATYYVVCSLIAAAILAVIRLLIPDGLDAYDDPPSNWEKWVHMALQLVLPAIAGGLTVWATHGRRPKLQ
jgi:cytochrome bd-type quinol oxidase subunit 2